MVNRRQDLIRQQIRPPQNIFCSARASPDHREGRLRRFAHLQFVKIVFNSSKMQLTARLTIQWLAPYRSSTPLKISSRFRNDKG